MSRANGETYIYSTIDWKDAPVFTAVFGLVVLFVILPIVVCSLRLCFYIRGSSTKSDPGPAIHVSPV